MGAHNICLYEEVDKNYTGCNLKTTELLECALIGACGIIRSNTVMYWISLPSASPPVPNVKVRVTWPCMLKTYISLNYQSLCLIFSLCVCVCMCVRACMRMCKLYIIAICVKSK